MVKTSDAMFGDWKNFLFFTFSSTLTKIISFTQVHQINRYTDRFIQKYLKAEVLLIENQVMF